MKPRTIFSAVAAISLILIFILPRLAGGGVAYAANDAALSPTISASDINILPADAALIQPTAAPPAPEPTPTAEAVAAAPVEVPALDGIPASLPPSSIPASAVAAGDLPTLEQFAQSIYNGQPAQVVGYYAPGLSALPVRQQPAADSDYISDEYGTVTQYHKPSLYGVIGLLAHNTLSGREFFYLGQNQDVYLVYGDGSTRRYRITGIQQYQALSPYDTRSEFVDLGSPGAPVLSHTEVFQRVYTNDGTLVLQTCIEANGEPTWGRLFVIAEPVY